MTSLSKLLDEILYEHCEDLTDVQHIKLRQAILALLTTELLASSRKAEHSPEPNQLTDPTALSMSQHIHESNLIEGYDDLRADQMSEAAWAWLMTKPALRLDNDIICQLQKQITLFQTDLKPAWRGKFRKIPVWVGGRACPDPEKIPGLMRHWLSMYTFCNAKTWHVEFEKIHPFVDGNGRTGRMLMWWMQYHQGEAPTLILNSKKQDYYKWFNASEVSSKGMGV